MLTYIKNNKLGSLTMALSLIFIFLGLPSQVLAIWKAKSVVNVSLVMFALLAAQSVAWVCYGLQKRDLFIVIPNAFVTLFGIAIVAECILFR